jgi:lipoprotein-anchoring transpeptidase ErfK/SrfK
MKAAMPTLLQARRNPLRSQIARPHRSSAAAAVVAFLVAVSTGNAADGGEKRVEIDKTAQVLRAYEGSELVFQTRVSTGRPGHETPNGSFRAGEKHLMHYSRLYHHAPMPYSVQVNGNYFIHGFTEVPAWPASHGCIRVPLDVANPAAWFYRWVDTGTPISIAGHWEGKPSRADKRQAAAELPGALRPRTIFLKR